MSAQHKGLDEMADLVAPGSIEAPSVVLGRMSGRGDRRKELPVDIVWGIEGEEEIGSPHLGRFAEGVLEALKDATAPHLNPLP